MVEFLELLYLAVLSCVNCLGWFGLKECRFFRLVSRLLQACSEPCIEPGELVSYLKETFLEVSVLFSVTRIACALSIVLISV